jgi:hypothetical protein
MIELLGFTTKLGQSYLKFKVLAGKIVEIPISRESQMLILRYLKDAVPSGSFSLPSSEEESD